MYALTIAEPANTAWRNASALDGCIAHLPIIAITRIRARSRRNPRSSAVV